MSGGLVKELMDPNTTLDVLRRAPLATGDFEKNRLAPKERRDLLNNLLLAYEHVPEAQRVCYFDVRPSSLAAGLNEMFIEPQAVSTNLKSGKSAKTLKPIFYLPYRKNGTTRIKLKQPAGWQGDEVCFFATAAIDGCSVYIEGPAATPKVSHANAAAISPTTAADTYPQKQVKIQAKIQNMDNRLQQLKKGPAVVVERPGYMFEVPLQVQVVKQQFAHWKGVPLAQVGSYSPFGAVVGVKGGGTWTFYLQKNGAFDHGPPGAQQTRSYMVLDAMEVFPHGGGIVRTLV